MGGVATLSYLLSRVAFLGTHAVFAYWLNMLLNDPFDLGLPTLDAKPTLPYGSFPRSPLSLFLISLSRSFFPIAGRASAKL